MCSTQIVNKNGMGHGDEGNEQDNDMISSICM